MRHHVQRQNHPVPREPKDLFIFWRPKGPPDVARGRPDVVQGPPDGRQNVPKCPQTLVKGPPDVFQVPFGPKKLSQRTKKSSETTRFSTENRETYVPHAIERSKTTARGPLAKTPLKVGFWDKKRYAAKLPTIDTSPTKTNNFSPKCPTKHSVYNSSLSPTFPPLSVQNGAKRRQKTSLNDPETTPRCLCAPKHGAKVAQRPPKVTPDTTQRPRDPPK